MDYSPCPAR